MKNTILVLLGCAAISQASLLYETNAGSTINGRPVDATAEFTASAGSLSIMFNNLISNPLDVNQAISDISFTVSNGNHILTSTDIASLVATTVTVDGNGLPVYGSISGANTTNWSLEVVNTNVLHLTALGNGQPEYMILGAPDANGVYSNANNGIQGNNAHNPFLTGMPVFTINLAGVTADSTISNVVFSFGSTGGLVAPSHVATPEPASFGLIGAGLLFTGLLRRKLTARG
jgi:hypothetical protein